MAMDDVIWSLLSASLAMMYGAIVNSDWKYGRAGEAGLVEACACAEIRDNVEKCSYKIIGWPARELFLGGSSECDSFNTVRVFAVITGFVALASAGAAMTMWSGRLNEEMRFTMLPGILGVIASILGLVATSVFVDMINDENDDGLTNTLSGHAFFIAGWTLLFVVSIAGMALRTRNLAIFHMVALVFFTAGLGSSKWTSILVREDLIVIPGFQTMIDQMHTNMGIFPLNNGTVARPVNGTVAANTYPSQASQSGRLDSILTPGPANGTANDLITLGLWDFCYCEDITVEDKCKWSGVEFLTGTDCDIYQVSVYSCYIATALMTFAVLVLYLLPTVFRVPSAVRRGLFITLSALGLALGIIGMATFAQPWPDAATGNAFGGAFIVFLIALVFYALSFLVIVAAGIAHLEDQYRLSAVSPAAPMTPF